MKKYTAHSIFIVSLIFIASVSFAQNDAVKASVDKDRILIGEPIHLQLEANLRSGVNTKWFLLDSIPHFEFIEKGKIDTINNGVYKQSIIITSFDSGRWVIPPLSLEMDGKFYMTDSFSVTVAFSAFDPKQDYHDIKDILEVEGAKTDYLKWGLIAAGILLLAALIVYLIRKYRKKVPKSNNIISSVGAYEEAIKALEELKQQQLSEKQLYTRLNDIIRWFVYRKAGVTTMQKTNEEFILQIEKLNMPREDFIALAQTLRMADAVKFAKFIPDEQDNNRSFQVIKKSIDFINNFKNSAL